MRIAILGAGAWGTALAQHAALRHDVVLWARQSSLLADLARTRRNQRYLPSIDLAPSIELQPDLSTAVTDADLVVLAIPVAGLRRLLGRLRQQRIAALCWLCKGLEANSGMLPHQIVGQAWGLGGAALSGPSFAGEVALGLPAALTAAASDSVDSGRLVAAFHHGAMRVYASTDLIGVEVGGAVKNVMAIAAGISDGLGLGGNARAALVTRGLAEMRRFAVALGGQPETLVGLAGLGDLVLTCTGDLSRNRRVGLHLAQGGELQRILADLGHVAEGVACCHAVVERAAGLGVDMPISRAVHEVLDGRSSARDAVRALLAREPASESE